MEDPSTVQSKSGRADLMYHKTLLKKQETIKNIWEHLCSNLIQFSILDSLLGLYVNNSHCKTNAIHITQDLKGTNLLKV